ncbi:MAG TPA: cupin domain-containing protein [Sphingomonadaceae bacterium]|nr:cupin domain-containing protein [Sphingomonadaceae bacterium]
MPKLDLEAIPQQNTTGYPPPFDAPMAGRFVRRLAQATGLRQLGAAHVVLRPGGWSSQRHWHAVQDELMVMLSGEAVLVEDEGETVLAPGDIVCWPAGVENGHHLQNRGERDCVFLVVSAGDPKIDHGEYPDIDMIFRPDGYAHKDGTPYPETRRAS